MTSPVGCTTTVASCGTTSNDDNAASSKGTTGRFCFGACDSEGGGSSGRATVCSKGISCTGSCRGGAAASFRGGGVPVGVLVAR